MRIAMVGTFDLRNYGDLLFPLLAKHELSKRLGEIEILPFSYLFRERSEWPYDVHPVEKFPQLLSDIDAVLVGGGHLVRFDHDVAPQYAPAASDIHHPTGLWLVPPFLAAAAGKPVVWNGIGASPDFEDWALGLFRSALEASTLVTARDRASRATLAAVSDRIEVVEVPDTAFGIADLLQEEEVEETYSRWKDAQGIRGGYAVVQPSPKLERVKGDLFSELDHLRARGMTLVEAPIGPVLGDQTGFLPPDWQEVLRLEPWPHPLLLAQIIAHADVSIGVSLHLGITSLCHGVPLHRPRCWPGSKYEILGDFPSVYQFDENGREPGPLLRGRLGRGEVSQEVRRVQRRVQEHWDDVAEAIVAKPRSTSYSAVGNFFFTLPFSLIDAQLAREAANSACNDRRHDQEEGAHETEQDAEQLLEAEARHRAEVERRNAFLEDRVSELSSAVAELAALQSRTDSDRAALVESLEDIHRSRAWRMSLRLRKAYLSLTGPWRYLRDRLRGGKT